MWFGKWGGGGGLFLDLLNDDVCGRPLYIYIYARVHEQARSPVLWRYFSLSVRRVLCLYRYLHAVLVICFRVFLLPELPSFDTCYAPLLCCCYYRLAIYNKLGCCCPSAFNSYFLLRRAVG